MGYLDLTIRMERKVDIIALKIDIIKRFGKEARSSYFGITDIVLRNPRGENISFFLQHYSNDKISYKIFFTDFISFEIRDEMLAQETSVRGIKFDKNYNGIIIHRILDGMYLDFLRKNTCLQMYEDVNRANTEKIQQYSIYEQNLVVDIITTSLPDIVLIED